MYRKMEILVDGTIQPCSCRVEPEIQGGNILDYGTLADAWGNPILQKFRDDWHAGVISTCCQQCSHYEPYTNMLRHMTPRAVARRMWQKLLP